MILLPLSEIHSTAGLRRNRSANTSTTALVITEDGPASIWRVSPSGRVTSTRDWAALAERCCRRTSPAPPVRDIAPAKQRWPHSAARLVRPDRTARQTPSAARNDLLRK